jgi:hypothetical protein
LYGGQVITDFDQQMSHFDSAVFGLQRIMSGRLDQSQANQVFQYVHVYGTNVGELLNRVQTIHQLHIQRVGTMTHQEKVISIGSGATISAPVVVADRIEGSFNALAKAPIDGDLKGTLEELLKHVAEVSKAIPSDQAEAMGRDAETLAKEVTSPKPRRRMLDVTVEGLKEAAIAVGEVGKPILQTVAKLLPLLANLIP